MLDLSGALISDSCNGGNSDAKMDGKAADVLPPFEIASKNLIPPAARLSMLGLVFIFQEQFKHGQKLIGKK